MTRTITYSFDFGDGVSWQYDLTFEKDGAFRPRDNPEIRDWTRLDFQKCPHCPLKPEESPQCPIARNLDNIVEDSKAAISWTKTVVTVTTPERTYTKACATQDGLRSLFGVVMASSGCPHLDWLRPLSRFHLPFSDTEETLFRVLSLQLLSSFIGNALDGPDVEIDKIKQRYRKVEQVNHAFIKRINEHCKADADKNALAALDVFVQLFPYQLESNFDSLRPFFKD